MNIAWIKKSLHCEVPELANSKTKSVSFNCSLRSIFSVLLFLLILLLIANSSLAQEKKVLVVGIDGLMPEAVGLAEMPNINALFEDKGGFVTYGYTEDLTFSGPSWSAILHGVHRDRHGVDSNQYHGHDFTDYSHFLKRLSDHDPDVYTAAYVTWSLLQNNFSDPDGTPVGVDELVYHARQEDGDEMVTDDLVELLKTGNPGAVFFYQNDVDAAGHGHGFSIDNPEYREQLQITDARVGRVLEALHNRPEVEQGEEEWLIMIVTDHGGVGTGHSGNLYRQRFIPMIASTTSNRDLKRPAIRIRNVDAFKTVLSWMEVSEDEFYGLDGHNLLDANHSHVPEAGYEKNLIFNGDGEFDRGFENRELDQAISGWRDQEHTGNLNGFHSMTLITAPSDIAYLDAGHSPTDIENSNLFTGGNSGLSSRISQHLDLSELQKDIDERTVYFELSAYLGGTGSSEDRMDVHASFLDEDGDVIDSARLETVTRDDRDGETLLIYRETDGFVFPGTRSVRIELHAIAASEGEGQGIRALADKLSFELIHDEDRSAP
jgi:hypothetical protein